MKFKRSKTFAILAFVALFAMALVPMVPQAEAAEVNVHWAPLDPSYQVLSYNVRCATNGTSNPGIVANVASTNYSATFPNGAIYYFSVQAVNMAGGGSWSAATATPPLPPAPSAPIVETSP